ncbi:MAG TPA: hypothetical protein VJA44_04050 [Acidimicrobiia bacterium]|nr:hypothetical protein [Acidimicrobiia bacterium]
MNRRHHLDLIRHELTVIGHDDKFRLRYSGTNTARRKSREFVESLVGEAPCSKAQLGLRVIDKLSGLPMSFVFEQDEDREKVLSIPFPRPLARGERFDIEITGLWPGNFTTLDDYAFFPMNPYKRGVSKLEATLILPKCPTYLRSRVVGRGAPGRLPDPTMRLRRDGQCAIMWQIDRPSGIYVLEFGRSDLPTP